MVNKSFDTYVIEVQQLKLSFTHTHKQFDHLYRSSFPSCIVKLNAITCITVIADHQSVQIVMKTCKLFHYIMWS